MVSLVYKNTLKIAKLGPADDNSWIGMASLGTSYSRARYGHEQPVPRPGRLGRLSNSA